MKAIRVTHGLAQARRLKWSPDVTDDFRTSRAMVFFAFLMSASVGICIVVLGGFVATAFVVSTLLALLIVFDFRIGAALLILTVPLSQSAFFPRALFGVAGANPYNLLVLASMGALLVRPVPHNASRLIFDKHFLWMIVPFALAAIHGLFNIDKIPMWLSALKVVTFEGTVGYFMEAVAKPLMLILLALVVATAIAEARKPERVLWLIMASALGLASMVIGYFILSDLPIEEISTSRARGFLTSTGYHANALGMILVSVFSMLLFAGAESSRSPLRFWLLASLIPVGLAIMLSFSRNAFILLVVIGIWYILSRKSLRSLFLASVTLVIIIIALPSSVYTRLGTGLDEGITFERDDPFTAGRSAGLWQPVMEDLANRPQTIVLGDGLEAMLWSDAVRSGRALPTGHPHNAYLKTVQDMGLVGLACLILFLRFILRKLDRVRGDARLDASLRGFFQGTKVAVFALLIGGLAGHSFTPDLPQMYLWLAFGVALGCSAAESSREDPRSGNAKPGK